MDKPDSKEQQSKGNSNPTSTKIILTFQLRCPSAELAFAELAFGELAFGLRLTQNRPASTIEVREFLQLPVLLGTDPQGLIHLVLPIIIHQLAEVHALLLVLQLHKGKLHLAACQDAISGNFEEP